MSDNPPTDESATSSGTADSGRVKQVRVTTNALIVRKPSIGKRFGAMLFRGAAEGVLEYIIKDVLLPSAREMIAEAAITMVERSVFGDNARPARRRPSSRGDGGYTSYNRFSGPPASSRSWDRDREEDRSRLSRRSREQHDFREIVLATEFEANEVIDRLYDIISQYKCASVADLYELVDAKSDYTDVKYGWYELRNPKAIRVREGYLLHLPKPILLDV